MRTVKEDSHRGIWVVRTWRTKGDFVALLIPRHRKAISQTLVVIITEHIMRTTPHPNLPQGKQHLLRRMPRNPVPPTRLQIRNPPTRPPPRQRLNLPNQPHKNPMLLPMAQQPPGSPQRLHRII